MKISLTQSVYGSRIWIDIESSDVCTRIGTSAVFDPYERLYIWLGQIRDSQLPASMVIDEEGYGVELIAEPASNEMILFRIDPWICGDDTETRLATIVKPDELLEAFHDGIAKFIKYGYLPSDWSYIDSLSNINWGILLKPSTISGQNWQTRLLMSGLGSYSRKIEKSEDLEDQALREQLTHEQQWLIVLRDALEQIGIIAAHSRMPDIQALVNLYRLLPVDIALGEVDLDWYQERRTALNQKHGLNQRQPSSGQEWERDRMLETARLKMLRVGQIVDGTVQRIRPYGLFVNIGGHRALLHISAISQMPVEKLDEVFKYGDWIRAMIVSIDIEKRRVALSTSDLEVEPGDMLKQPCKVYETAELMASRYYQNLPKEE